MLEINGLFDNYFSKIILCYWEQKIEKTYLTIKNFNFLFLRIENRFFLKNIFLIVF